MNGRSGRDVLSHSQIRNSSLKHTTHHHTYDVTLDPVNVTQTGSYKTPPFCSF